MYFIRRLYHCEQLGPFPTLAEARAYIAARKVADPHWDYDPPGIGRWDDYPEVLPLAAWVE